MRFESLRNNEISKLESQNDQRQQFYIIVNFQNNLYFIVIRYFGV